MCVFKKLRKQIAVLFLVSFFINIAQAADPDYTWKTITNTDMQTSVFVVGSNIYVGTQSGIWISTNGGVSWTTKLTSDGLASNMVNCLHVSGTNIYAGTEGNGISISTDSGTTWVTKTTANGLGNNYIYGVYTTGTNVYAATGAGLSISTDSGATWVNKTTTNGLGNNSISGVYASGANIYAATSGGLSISTDGGITWVNKTTANGLGNNTIRSVYASGANIYVARSTGVSISTDSGTTWLNRTTANGLGNNSVLSIYASGANVYAATTGGVSISTDNGTSWVNKTTAHGLAYNYSTGVYASGSNIYAATWGGLSISTDGGTAWTKYTSSFANNNVYTVFNSGTNIYAATNGGGLSISSDGGTTWVKYKNSFGSNSVWGIFSSGSNVYAATGGGLSISTDSGTTWVNKTTADGLGNNYVYGAYASGSNIYAATSGGLSISTDSGAHWVNKTTADGLGNNTIYGVYSSGTKIYAATWGGGLAISTDSGATWVNKTTADGLVSNSIFRLHGSGTNIYAGTTGQGLSISTDGGTTWVTKTTDNGLGNNYIYGIYTSGSNIYVATNVGGLSISSDGGTTWVTKTTANGLGNNNVRSVYASGSNIYAGSEGGLSISSDGGTTWLNKTTADGLIHNQVNGVYAIGSNIYAATQGGLSVATLKSAPLLPINSISYNFNRSGDEITYTANKDSRDIATIKIAESKLGLGSLTQSNFSDVVMSITPQGKPSLVIPEANPIAATVNASHGAVVVTASFTGLPKQTGGKIPAIMMNGKQITDTKGNVFPAYTGYVRNITWDNNTGTLTFGITHFTEYGIPVLVGKTFAGTASGQAINALGSDIVIDYYGGSLTGDPNQDRSTAVLGIHGLAYETVLTDAPVTLNNLYKSLVPGQTYGISFEYINRGNAVDDYDINLDINKAINDHYDFSYTTPEATAPWQVVSCNVYVNPVSANAFERATMDVTIFLNGITGTSYNAFENAYQGGTYGTDGQYGGVTSFQHRFVLEAEGYSLSILSRSITINAPLNYTGDPVSETNIVPGAKVKYTIVLKNNNNSVATSVNLTDIIPDNCHLYYTETPTVQGAALWAWRGATDNNADKNTADAVKYEITIPAQGRVTASYSVTVD